MLMNRTETNRLSLEILILLVPQVVSAADARIVPAEDPIGLCHVAYVLRFGCEWNSRVGRTIMPLPKDIIRNFHHMFYEDAA